MNLGGYDVTFNHDVKRGVTVCTITGIKLVAPHGPKRRMAVGVSVQEQFSRWVGRKDALCHALRNFERNERINIWIDYKDKGIRYCPRPRRTYAAATA